MLAFVLGSYVNLVSKFLMTAMVMETKKKYRRAIRDLQNRAKEAGETSSPDGLEVREDMEGLLSR
jgi:hypothetical protein